jgi:hypothetical protein
LTPFIVVAMPTSEWLVASRDVWAAAIKGMIVFCLLIAHGLTDNSVTRICSASGFLFTFRRRHKCLASQVAPWYCPSPLLQCSRTYLCYTASGRSFVVMQQGIPLLYYIRTYFFLLSPLSHAARVYWNNTCTWNGQYHFLLPSFCLHSYHCAICVLSEWVIKKPTPLVLQPWRAHGAVYTLP